MDLIYPSPLSSTKALPSCNIDHLEWLSFMYEEGRRPGMAIIERSPYEHIVNDPRPTIKEKHSLLTLGTKLSFVRRSFGVPYSSTAHLQYVCSTSALLQVYRWLRSALTGVGDGEYKCLLGLRWSTMSRSMPSYMRDLYHLVETAQTIGRWRPRTNLMLNSKVVLGR